MDKLRMGIAGIGLYAATAHVPQFRDTGRAEVVAIARRNAERLELAQEALAIPQSYNSWQLMLMEADLDALVVCTPNNFHVEPTIAALEQGLHVLVEKPMALTSADAQKMASAAKEAEGILMVGYNARGMGSWRAVKEALLAGRIGTIQQINVTSGIDGRALISRCDHGQRCARLD